MSRLQQLYEVIKNRKLDTDDKVRSYLKVYNVSEDIVDDIIKRLIRDGVIEGEIPAEKPSSYSNSYKKAIAFYFRNNPVPGPKAKMVQTITFKYDWFTPTDSSTFVGFLLRDKLLREDAGVIIPNFDINEVPDMPFDWSINDELGLPKASDIAKAERQKAEHDKQMEYVRREAEEDAKATLLEEGFDLSDDEQEFKGMDRVNEVEKQVLQQLKSMGIQKANIVWEYHELNYGLYDLPTMTHELGRFIGTNKIEKCFELLNDKRPW